MESIDFSVKDERVLILAEQAVVEGGLFRFRGAGYGWLISGLDGSGNGDL
jgi:hypothetical protein